MSRPIAALLFLPLAWGQRPEFEVASIKPSPPGIPAQAGCYGGPPIDPTLVRCSNYDLRNLVGDAWGLATWEYKGLDWMSEAKFDIVAKIPPGTTREQYRQMFQALYEQRFHLTYHRAPAQVDGYELVLAKGQLKVAGAMPKGFPDPPRRGISQNGLRRVMRYDGVTMAEIAQRLGYQLRAPVVDATGLEGTRDLLLYWVVDNPMSEGLDLSGPTFKEAVRSQLGWRLEPKKVDVSVFVVDHMDKTPTDN
jgi:uncharacterized protein (TIGR03435 family)